MSLIMLTISSICSGSTISLGQVIVDLDVGQKALLLAARNQQLQLRLTLIGNLCRFLLCCQGSCSRLGPSTSAVWVGGLKKTAQCTWIALRTLGSLPAGPCLDIGPRLASGSRLQTQFGLAAGQAPRVLCLLTSCVAAAGSRSSWSKRSRAPSSSWAAPAASGSGTPARRACRGAQHRGDRASVQAERRLSHRVDRCSSSTSSDQQGIPGRSIPRQRRRSRRPCRRFAGSEPGAEPPGEPGCRRPGPRGVRRPAAGAGLSSRDGSRGVLPVLSAARQALRVEADDLGDFIDQQLAVDAGRNALEQGPARARRGVRGRRPCSCRPATQVTDEVLGQRHRRGEPRFERFAAFLADQRIRIVSVRQEQEAHLPALAHLARANSPARATRRRGRRDRRRSRRSASLQIRKTRDRCSGVVAVPSVATA